MTALRPNFNHHDIRACVPEVERPCPLPFPHTAALPHRRGSHPNFPPFRATLNDPNINFKQRTNADLRNLLCSELSSGQNDSRSAGPTRRIASDPTNWKTIPNPASKDDENHSSTMDAQSTPSLTITDSSPSSPDLGNSQQPNAHTDAPPPSPPTAPSRTIPQPKFSELDGVYVHAPPGVREVT